MTTGSSGWRSASRRCSSSPPISGMPISTSAQPGPPRPAARKARAEGKSSTSKPLVSSRIFSESRIASSSSMMKRMGLLAIRDRLLARDRQVEDELGSSAVDIRFGTQGSAMRIDDRAADRQAEPHSRAFGRNERLEELLAHHRRQARARVADADQHQIGVFGA